VECRGEAAEPGSEMSRWRPRTVPGRRSTFRGGARAAASDRAMGAPGREVTDLPNVEVRSAGPIRKADRVACVPTWLGPPPHPRVDPPASSDPDWTMGRGPARSIVRSGSAPEWTCSEVHAAACVALGATEVAAVDQPFTAGRPGLRPLSELASLSRGRSFRRGGEGAPDCSTRINHTFRIGVGDTPAALEQAARRLS
jgi:hypothetical protein